MILRIFFILFGFLLMQACQLNREEYEDNKLNNQKRSQAAGYNVQLGLGYLKQGDISRAKGKLLLAMKQNPKSPEVNAAMAYFMEKTGDNANAKLYYLKAMSAAPRRGTQLNNYGAFLCRQGQYTQAESYFLKAANDIQYERTAGAYENAGLCALAIPNDEKAIHFFKKALVQDPSRQQSLYELLKLDIKLGHYDEAMKIIRSHSAQMIQSKALLDLAVKVTHQLGKTELEEEYRRLRFQSE